MIQTIFSDPFQTQQRAALKSGAHHVIGIDPGVHGAIARLGGDELEVADLPLDAKGQIDTQALFEMRILYSALPGSIVWIEDVHSMPRQGVASSFNFGRTVGRIEGVATCMFGAEKVRHVTPTVWKYALGLRAAYGTALRERKNASRARADDLYPQHAALWARAKDDGRAEAVLIAHYGRHHGAAR